MCACVCVCVCVPMCVCVCVTTQVCEELTFGTSTEWETWPKWRQRLRHMSFCLLLPVYGALRLTVPMADPETYNQQWLVVSVLCW